MMNVARGIVTDSEATSHGDPMNIHKMLGEFDVDLVLYIFRKLPKERSVKSMLVIGNRFYTSLAKHMGDLQERLQANPWSIDSADADAATMLGSSRDSSTSARMQNRRYSFSTNQA